MKKAFLLFNLLVAVVLAIVIGRDVIADRSRAVESGYRNLEMITAAVAEHTQQTLAALDLGLITLARHAETIGMSEPDQIAALHREAGNRQAASTNTFAFYIIGADGVLLVTSRTAEAEAIDLSMMSEFFAHRDGDAAGLHLAAPRLGVIGNSEGRWIINLSRRIADADDNFLGVAAASLSLDYLVDFYSTMRVGQQGALGLLSASGITLARSPLVPELLGIDMSQNSQFLQAMADGNGGRATDVALQAGVPRLSAFRFAWGDELIAYANIATAEVLAEWREHTLFKLVIAALVVILLGSGSLVIMFFLRRRQQWTEQTLRDQQAALAQINAAKAEIEAVFTAISDAVFSLDTEWRFFYLNAEAERVLERPATELIGKNIWKVYPDTVGNDFYHCYTRAREENIPTSLESYYPPLNKWFSVRAFPHDNGLTVYLLDVTDRHEMEERLRQSQKMDAVGQLTGGIAHDFNNLLTVILGNIDLLQEHLADQPEQLRKHADVVRIAGERAAELTRRLLAFARRQPLNPQQTDINVLMLEAEQLLSRTVGENISIELARAEDLWPAIVDPHELQNAVINLAINARDAMPDGGKLTLETANMIIDDDYAAQHGIAAGHYVMVAVSDTGCGMSPELVSRAFDPFFTTKPEGKGSGLGLAMVYGFAHQSGGHVKIYSELNEGTTIRLYLPKADTVRRDDEAGSGIHDGRVGGNEAILLVEDDPLVRSYTLNSLRRLGYSVTECADGAEAIASLNAGPRYHLLLTDVVLAGGVSGKEVAMHASTKDPGIKVLYMSGYAENAIVHHGRLDHGVNLLSKPFRSAELARRVRELLDLAK